MFSYIAPGAKQYRANLHSHTNLSDGTLTPEQMVQAYQEKKLLHPGHHGPRGSL